MLIGVASVAVLSSGAKAGRSNSLGISRHVTVAAKPGPITIDLAKIAVLVVDMQNDFGTKGGMFD